MNPCESCHAGCCRSFTVQVTGADILRIERDLQLDFWDFACRWADPNGDVARDTAPQFYFEDDPETPYVICLMHVDSRVHPGTTMCRFLEESPIDAEHPRGVARCGIYDSRPATCRVFPTKLNETADLAVLYDVPARGRGTDEPAYELCPTEWSPADVDPLQTMDHLVLAKYEMAFFHHLADIWNRQPQSWQLFPDFLRAVYASRVIKDPQAAEPPQKIRFPSDEERAPRTEGRVANATRARRRFSKSPQGRPRSNGTGLREYPRFSHNRHIPRNRADTNPACPQSASPTDRFSLGSTIGCCDVEGRGREKSTFNGERQGCA